LHPWDEGNVSGVNQDGIRRSGNDFKFFDRRPTYLADYQPLLKSKNNTVLIEEKDWSQGGKPFTSKHVLKGPHPALIVTKIGYISYGTGKNTKRESHLNEKLDVSSVYKIPLTDDHFHRY
jgi:hypothetical protein